MTPSQRSKAAVFGIVGPLGLGRAVNDLLGRDLNLSFGARRYRYNQERIRVLRFSKRFGVLAGWRVLFDSRYDNYLSEQSASETGHWMSD